MKDDRLYLIHIDECVRRIQEYVVQGKEAFMDSTLIQDAVLRNLQILAESTQRLSDNLKSQHKEVDWRGISGFRNVLVHDYLGIDIEYVWQVVEVHVLLLGMQIHAMVRDECVGERPNGEGGGYNEKR